MTRTTNTSLFSIPPGGRGCVDNSPLDIEDEVGKDSVHGQTSGFSPILIEAVFQCLVPASVGTPVDFEDAESGRCRESHNLHEVDLAPRQHQDLNCWCPAGALNPTFLLLLRMNLLWPLRMWLNWLCSLCFGKLML